VIQSVEGAAKPQAVSVDWTRVEAAIKRVEGVNSATLDSDGRRIQVSYTGIYSNIERIRNAAQTAGLSAELLSPARVVFRPMSAVDDETKLTNSFKALAGATFVTRENSDLHIYADLSTLDLDQVVQAARTAGVKGMISTHEMVRVRYSTGGGDPQTLVDELSRTKWVLKAEIESGTNTVAVLAIKGRVTRALVKSIMSRCGFAESK
jgi:copper chaperone CopZ